MSSIPIFWWLVLIVVVAAAAALIAAVRRVPQGFEQLVERRGRYLRTIGAGTHLIVPGVDRIGAVQDIREAQLAIKKLSLVTRDEVSVEVVLSCFVQVVDAAKASYEIKGMRAALEELIATQASSVLAACPLTQLVSDRDRLLRELPERLDRATDAWGVKVTRLDIRDVRPPAALLDAILEERRAEHVQRAAMLVAETERTQALEAADRARLQEISLADMRLNAALDAAKAAEQQTRLEHAAQLAHEAREQEQALAHQAREQEQAIAQRQLELEKELAQRKIEQDLALAQQALEQARELARQALEQEQELAQQKRGQELSVALQLQQAAAARAQAEHEREQADAQRLQRELDAERALHVHEQEIAAEQAAAAAAWRQELERAEREREAVQMRHAAEQAQEMHETQLTVLAAERVRAAQRIRDMADAERALQLQQVALAEAELARDQAQREPALREEQARREHALAMAQLEQHRQLERARLEAAREKQELELQNGQRAAELVHQEATLRAQARELVADADARAVQKLAAALGTATPHAVTYLAAREHADALRSLGQSNARVVVVPGSDTAAGLDALARMTATPAERD